MTARPIIMTGASVPDIREAVARAIFERKHRGLSNIVPWDDLHGYDPYAREFYEMAADAALSVLIPAAVDVVRGKRRICKVYDLQMSAYNDGVDDAIEALSAMTKEAVDG